MQLPNSNTSTQQILNRVQPQTTTNQNSRRDTKKSYTDDQPSMSRKLSKISPKTISSCNNTDATETMHIITEMNQEETLLKEFATF